MPQKSTGKSLEVHHVRGRLLTFIVRALFVKNLRYDRYIPALIADH